MRQYCLPIIALALHACASTADTSAATEPPVDPTIAAAALCTALQPQLEAMTLAIRDRTHSPDQAQRYLLLRQATYDACTYSPTVAQTPLDPNCADIQLDISKHEGMARQMPQFPAFREIVRRRKDDLDKCQTKA